MEQQINPEERFALMLASMNQMNSKKSRTHGFLYFVGGIGVGIVVPKLLPKTSAVKTVKFFKEVILAQSRLQKVLIEDYARIDEAVQSEMSFLAMIDPHTKITDMFDVTLSVVDDGKDRKIDMGIKQKKKQDDS